MWHLEFPEMKVEVVVVTLLRLLRALVLYDLLGLKCRALTIHCKNITNRHKLLRHKLAGFRCRL